MGGLDLRHALSSAARLSPLDVIALIRIAAVLLFVEAAVRTVPVARLAGWLGVDLRLSLSPSPGPTGPSAADFGPAELRRARLARKVVAHWPFGAGPCLRESLVLGHILRRHHPAMRLGVARDGEEITAHAWLEVGGVSLEADRGYLPLGL